MANGTPVLAPVADESDILWSGVFRNGVLVDAVALEGFDIASIEVDDFLVDGCSYVSVYKASDVTSNVVVEHDEISSILGSGQFWGRDHSTDFFFKWLNSQVEGFTPALPYGLYRDTRAGCNYMIAYFSKLVPTDDASAFIVAHQFKEIYNSNDEFLTCSIEDGKADIFGMTVGSGHIDDSIVIDGITYGNADEVYPCPLCYPGLVDALVSGSAPSIYQKAMRLDGATVSDDYLMEVISDTVVALIWDDLTTEVVNLDFVSMGTIGESSLLNLSIPFVRLDGEPYPVACEVNQQGIVENVEILDARALDIDAQLPMQATVGGEDASIVGFVETTVEDLIGTPVSYTVPASLSD